MPAVEKRGAFSRGAAAVPVKTLSTIMHELHHEWVDLLKARHPSQRAPSLMAAAVGEAR